MDLYQYECESPIGVIYLVSDETNLRALEFENKQSRLHRLLANHYGRYTLHAGRGKIEATTRLKSYFDGDLQAGDDLAVETNGTTFQREVWAALRQIPAGSTVSYSTIANRIGRPKACRAVGLANGSNPIGIFVPCHRVIGANNSLTGYAGGIERKQWLLNHEGAVKHSHSERTMTNLFADLPV